LSKLEANYDFSGGIQQQAAQMTQTFQQQQQGFG